MEHNFQFKVYAVRLRYNLTLKLDKALENKNKNIRRTTDLSYKSYTHEISVSGPTRTR